MCLIMHVLFVVTELFSSPPEAELAKTAAGDINHSPFFLSGFKLKRGKEISDVLLDCSSPTYPTIKMALNVFGKQHHGTDSRFCALIFPGLRMFLLGNACLMTKIVYLNFRINTFLNYYYFFPHKSCANVRFV